MGREIYVIIRIRRNLLVLLPTRRKKRHNFWPTILKTDKNYSKVEFFVKIDILNEYLIYMKVRKIIPHIHCIRVKLFANFRILRISFFEYDNAITNEDVIMIFINRIYNERVLYYI